MRVQMVQHAVGQGGLFSGRLDAGGKPFRWCYDCGSNQREPLVREIGVVASEGPLDMLFLSHLDSDHVSGIDTLLANCDVREVVLPYFEEDVLLAAIARDAARGRLSGQFLEMASNIVSWFGNRGVATVTLVGGSDESGDGPALPPEGPIDDGRGDAEQKWTLPPTPIGATYAVYRAARPRTTVAQLAASNAAVAVLASQQLLNWVLIPYVHAPAARRMEAFRAAMEHAFGTPLDKDEILHEARSSTGRDQLRALYDELWQDHNLISMSLYSGPLQGGIFQTRCLNSELEHINIGPEAGWLLTGDADILAKRRRERFTRHYGKVSTFVGVLMAPHHGSAHSFSPLALQAFPMLRIGYAAAGANSYGHPHGEVEDAFSASTGTTFLQVGERRASQLIVRARARR